MRRGVNGGESRRNSNSNNTSYALDTVNAAATAIASAEARGPPSSNSQKKRWRSFFSVYWCFGSPRHSKRYSQAVLVPEPLETRNDSSSRPNNSAQAPSIVIPFAAPPSSPASFLPSEPPSAIQSPAGVISINISNNMYSPGNPRNIYATGPYANEAQLVSPPVFSTYTTEPSTAPFTPPPESVHLTTPSSPEVPFAQLLDPRHRNDDSGYRFPLSHYEFPTYQIYPDSLVSPGSVVSNSGTSSPFPDRELYVGRLHYPDVRLGVPHKLMNLELPPRRDWGSQQGSGALTPDAGWPMSGTRTPDAGWPMSGTRTPDAGWPMSGTRTPDTAWPMSGNRTPDAGWPMSGTRTPDGQWSMSGAGTPDATWPMSGNRTPDAVWPMSCTRTPDATWPKSGTPTPDSTHPKSSSLTPNTMRFKSGDNILVRQDSTVSLLPNLPKGHTKNEAIVDHRVSFELTAEDVIRFVEKERTTLPKALRNASKEHQDDSTSNASNNRESSGDAAEKSTVEGEEGQRSGKQRSASLGTIKEFNFDNAKGTDSHKSCIGSNWWANEKVVGNDGEFSNKDWSFPTMHQQPSVS